MNKNQNIILWQKAEKEAYNILSVSFQPLTKKIVFLVRNDYTDQDEIFKLDLNHAKKFSIATKAMILSKFADCENIDQNSLTEITYDRKWIWFQFALLPLINLSVDHSLIIASKIDDLVDRKEISEVKKFKLTLIKN